MKLSAKQSEIDARAIAMEEYRQKMKDEEVKRGKYVEKLEQDMEELLDTPTPLWLGLQEVPNAIKPPANEQPPIDGTVSQELCGLPNPYGWLYVGHPDDPGMQKSLSAPFDVEVPTETKRANPDPSQAIQQSEQMEAITSQQHFSIPVPSLPEVLAVSAPTAAGPLGNQSIQITCGPGVAVNIIPFDVTAEEVLTFFPLHFRWSGYLERFIRNGWEVSSIANYINWARGLTGDKAFRTSNLQTAVRLHELQSISTDRGTESRLSPIHWKPNHRRRIVDILLVDLAEHIANWPTGPGCGTLTKCVLHAVAHPEKELKLSNVDQMVLEHGIPLLARLAGENLDMLSLQRFKYSNNNVQRTDRR